MLYCKACLTKYDDGIEFCKVCGSKLVLYVRNDSSKKFPAVQISEKNNDCQSINNEINIKKDHGLPANKNKFTLSGIIFFKKKIFSKMLSFFDRAYSLKGKTEQSPARNSNLHNYFLKSFHEIAQTAFKMSVLKTLAIVIILLSIITGGYWRYIKYVSDEKIANPISTGSVQENNRQLQEPNKIFEIIKKANLTKDIDLFMSCYSPNFKSLDNKKASKIKIWNNYNYNILKYNVKGFIILKDKASGLVEWEFYAQQIHSEHNFSAITLYNVVLEKDNEGKWKILSLVKL